MRFRVIFLLTICTFLYFNMLKPARATQQKTTTIPHLTQDSPAFLTKEQVHSDLEQFIETIQKAYGSYDTLARQGLLWKEVFQEAYRFLETSKGQYLTHQFMQHLIHSLSPTSDPSFSAEAYIHNRRYQASVQGRFISYYSKVKLIKEGERYRVLPISNIPDISNDWFLGCDDSSLPTRLFPILPERQREAWYLLGVVADTPPPAFIECTFETNLKTIVRKKLSLFSAFSEQELLSDTPIFRWSSHTSPYIRWIWEGPSESQNLQEFFNIADKVRPFPVLIIDVRGNTTGSFQTIQRWLAQLTRSQWQNVIVKERNNLMIYQGLFNRVRWLRASAATAHARLSLDQELKQILTMMGHETLHSEPERWVETKFIFTGNRLQPVWDKHLIIIADRQCGEGCQFLAALSKQLDSSLLLGDFTGPYPRQSRMPLYQLEESKIILTINHTLHSNHQNEIIPPAGYTPDFWLDPTDSVEEIQQFAKRFSESFRY